MTKFNTYLESNDFDRLKRFFEEHGELQHYRKGNFFARQGEYSSQAALIKDGTFAYTHIDNEGKEHYVWVCLPRRIRGRLYLFHATLGFTGEHRRIETLHDIFCKPTSIARFLQHRYEILRYNCLMAEKPLRNGLFRLLKVTAKLRKS